MASTMNTVAGVLFANTCTCEYMATVVARASVVHLPVICLSSVNSQFLGKRCMDPGQILWSAPYPQYLHIIFRSG